MMLTAGERIEIFMPPGKALVIFPVEPGYDGVRIEPADCMIEDEFQRDAWRFPGRFYALGAEVLVPNRWHVTRSPKTPEAKRIAELYGVPVAACYSRPPGPVKL